MDGHTVHGILQARILEWVALPFSRGSFQPRDQTQSPTLQADSLPAEPPERNISPQQWDIPFTKCYSFPFHNITNRIMPQCIIIQRRQWRPTPVLLPGKSHGWRSLVGCSPWGHEESDTTERLHFHFSLSCIGEGRGNPLQCSCLENPRGGGAWWAAVYGVTQSWTQLK